MFFGLHNFRGKTVHCIVNFELVPLQDNSDNQNTEKYIANAIKGHLFI